MKSVIISFLFCVIVLLSFAQCSADQCTNALINAMKKEGITDAQIKRICNTTDISSERQGVKPETTVLEFFDAINRSDYTTAKLCITGPYPPDEMDMARIKNRWPAGSIKTVDVISSSARSNQAIVKVAVNTTNKGQDIRELSMVNAQGDWKIFYNGYNAFWTGH